MPVHGKGKIATILMYYDIYTPNEDRLSSFNGTFVVGFLAGQMPVVHVPLHLLKDPYSFPPRP